MTALKQQAFEMLETFPDEKLLTLIQFMQAEKMAMIKKAQRIEKKRAALDELKKLCKPIPDLDYDKALAQYREEKFGNANFN